MTKEYLHFKVYYKDGTSKEFRNVESYNWVGWEFLFMRFHAKLVEKSENFKTKEIEITPGQYPLGHHASEWVFIPVKEIIRIETLSQTTWETHNDKAKYIKDVFGRPPSNAN